MLTEQHWLHWETLDESQQASYMDRITPDMYQPTQEPYAFAVLRLAIKLAYNERG